MNLEIRPITAADRQPNSCSLAGYWGIFEDGRVGAVSRDKSDLESILKDVHGIEAAQAQRAAA